MGKDTDDVEEDMASIERNYGKSSTSTKASSHTLKYRSPDMCLINSTRKSSTKKRVPEDEVETMGLQSGNIEVLGKKKR